MAEIILEGVTKRFPDGALAVKDVDLEIADGEFVILVGPSGCGKSTTLNMIAGLEDITEGSLRIGGRVVNDLAPKERDVAMVYQSYALYPHMNVRENMGFPLRLAKVDKDAHQRQGDGSRPDPRPHRAPGPQARQPLGRSAPTGGHGAGGELP
ncbi:Trehalose import ATP-binding protein SugC [Streptomyces alboniger]